MKARAAIALVSLGVLGAATTRAADEDDKVSFEKDRKGTISKAERNWRKIQSAAVESL